MFPSTLHLTTSPCTRHFTRLRRTHCGFTASGCAVQIAVFFSSTIQLTTSPCARHFTLVGCTHHWFTLSSSAAHVVFLRGVTAKAAIAVRTTLLTCALRITLGTVQVTTSFRARRHRGTRNRCWSNCGCRLTQNNALVFAYCAADVTCCRVFWTD